MTRLSPAPHRAATVRERVQRKFEVRSSKFEKALVLAVAQFVLLMSPACVRRTIKITTEPPNARVFLNDQEIGRSEVTSDFLWYGDYDVTIRKEGYATLQTNWEIKAPWYQWVPVDFFAEVLWPGQIHDQRERHFILEPAQSPTQEELLQRAAETRDQALGTGK